MTVQHLNREGGSKMTHCWEGKQHLQGEEKMGKKAGEKVIFWELKRMAATASLITLGAWAFQSY